MLLSTLLVMGLGGQEIIIIALILLLLFGGKKIPELMKGMGRGIKEFKDASKGLAEKEEEKK
jgi:sec-independent protein translocase protein TatA